MAQSTIETTLLSLLLAGSATPFIIANDPAEPAPAISAAPPPATTAPVGEGPTTSRSPSEENEVESEDSATSARDVCLFGCPAGAPDANQVLVRPTHALSNNGDTKFADWVAYKVRVDAIGPTKKRNWKADPELPEDATLEPADYDGANTKLRVDRGHQAPLASFTGTPFWSTTNYLSNITPQRSALNQGPWERIESAERALAQGDGTPEVFVVTGPLYERDMPSLPGADEDHAVPSGYWKVIAVRAGATAETVAFVFDQETPRNADECGAVVSVGEVERRSKLNLFPELPDEGSLDSAEGTLAGGLGCLDE